MKNMFIHLISLVVLFSVYVHSFQSFQCDNQAVPGWPSQKITSASVSGANSARGNYNFDQLVKRPVRSVFTYAQGGGGDAYNLQKIDTPNKTLKILEQARKLEDIYDNQRQVMPVIVVYTAGGSTGVETINIDLGQDSRYADNLWKRYYNLIRIAQVSESYKDEKHPTPATFVINPDLLGEINKSCQKYYCPVAYKTMAIPTHAALLKAFSSLHADGYLNQLPDIPDDLQSDQLNLAGYIKSVNRLIG